ncbi:MAG: hypothetical protein IJS13_06475 [Paludibacteraceae bacterium]|nr:hypothetical protein [Paludibacteraceae bacterium]
MTTSAVSYHSVVRNIRKSIRQVRSAPAVQVALIVHLRRALRVYLLPQRNIHRRQLRRLLVPV